MSENRKCVNCRHNIRKEKPSGNKSCKYCKHFLEIPQKLSLGDLKQEYLRFCVISGLHEPIDDTWELEHELCFVRKENENAENKG